jgi:hypothetical protein
MKKFITLSALMLAAAISNAQTTATNWTAPDCNATSHTLFNELDNGKIVVMVWVMPCGSCVNGAKAAYNVYQQYETSNPGKVVYYLADDFGDASCAQLNSWITSNNIGDPSKMTIFSNSGNIIDESNFGGSGMPHVAVMAGTDHKIYYNKKNGAANDPAGIQNAVQTALNVVTGVSNIGQIRFSVSPNPATELIQIDHKTAVSRIVITSVTGQLVKELDFTSGSRNPHVSLSGIVPGVYTLKVIDTDGKSGIQKIVKE